MKYLIVLLFLTSCTENTWLKRRFTHQKYEFTNIRIEPSKKEVRWKKI